MLPGIRLEAVLSLWRIGESFPPTFERVLEEIGRDKAAVSGRETAVVGRDTAVIGREIAVIGRVFCVRESVSVRPS